MRQDQQFLRHIICANKWLPAYARVAGVARDDE